MAPKTSAAPEQDIVAPETPEVEAVEEEVSAEVVAEPNGLVTNLPPIGKESTEAFVARLRGHTSFDGQLQWVPCPLPGYEKVRVGYNVDNAFAVANLFIDRPPGLSLMDTYKLWSLFIRKVEGLPGGAPSPDPEQEQSYERLLLEFRSLLEWARDEGYAEAKSLRWGN